MAFFGQFFSFLAVAGGNPERIPSDSAFKGQEKAFKILHFISCWHCQPEGEVVFVSRSIGRLVSILYRKNQVYLNLVLKPYNMAASEVPVITYLYSHDGVSQEELSSFLMIDKAATARVTQSLLEKQFIRKERDLCDKRVNRIYLEEKVLKIRADIIELLQQWSGFLAEGLDEETVEAMYVVLESMVAKVEKTDFCELWGNE